MSTRNYLFLFSRNLRNCLLSITNQIRTLLKILQYSIEVLLLNEAVLHFRSERRNLMKNHRHILNYPCIAGCQIPLNFIHFICRDIVRISFKLPFIFSFLIKLIKDLKNKLIIHRNKQRNSLLGGYISGKGYKTFIDHTETIC